MLGESGEENIIHVNDDMPYHRQILLLLRDILHKLYDIHEELVNQPTILIDESSTNTSDSFDSPV